MARLPWFPFVAWVSVLGCTGEQVETSQSDASAPDTSVSDASVDSLDASVSEAAGDTGGCTKYPGNLIPDGDFATGVGAWRPYQCKIDVSTAGRCGNALRVYELVGPGRAYRTVEGISRPAGTKLHLRAWAKKGLDEPPTGTSFILRAYRTEADGGEATTDYNATIIVGDTWRPTDVVFTLTREMTAFELFADTYMTVSTTKHDYLLADVSIVEE